MSTKREILEKLLALANDSCSKYESELAYAKYLALKEKFGEEEAKEEIEKEWNAYDESTWSEEERKEYDYWRGGKFSFERTEKFLNEVYKVEGGYLIRRLAYLEAMSVHFQNELYSFGHEYEGVYKNCIKQIEFFEGLQCDEFGTDEEGEHDWYKNTDRGFTFYMFQGFDDKKRGSPKINYLMFVSDEMKIILEGFIDFKNAKPFDNSKVTAFLEKDKG